MLGNSGNLFFFSFSSLLYFGFGKDVYIYKYMKCFYGPNYRSQVVTCKPFELSTILYCCCFKHPPTYSFISATDLTNFYIMERVNLTLFCPNDLIFFNVISQLDDFTNHTHPYKHTYNYRFISTR